MSDLQATLAAIDELAVQQCGHCSRPLREEGQSPDFCDDYCQQAWTAARNEVVELLGYSEPYDMPEYYANQVELYSPEVRPAVQTFGCSCGSCSGTTDRVLTFNLTIDDSRFREAISGMWERLYSAYYEQTLRSVWQGTGRLTYWAIDETRWFSLAPTIAEPEPPAESELFDPDYEYDWTPVPALHAEQTALPVMAEHGHDWQALANARRPQDRFSVSAERERRGSTNRRVR